MTGGFELETDWKYLNRTNPSLIGRKLYHFDEVDSTNKVADKMARNGIPEGTVILADSQTCGQGRLDRRWVSLKNKGVWFSVVLRPQSEPATAVQLTLLAAVATSIGLENCTGVRAGIKWPNDLLIQGKKVCGILCEMDAGDTIDHVVIGIGINANMTREDFGPELHETATSILLATGCSVVDRELLEHVLDQLNYWYVRWREEGFGPIRAAWNELNVTLNHQIKVDCGDKAYFGQAVSIDDEGALLLRDAGGQEQKFNFGEVSVRNLEG